MSAPVTERTRAAARGAGRSRTATIPAQRGGPAVAPRPTVAPRPPATQRSPSAQRAYAKRDDRVRRLVGGRPDRAVPSTGRAQFVLLVMVLLGSGLVLTLWLSTAAAADSYRLQEARAQALVLSEQSERLHREVAAMASAPALAARAAGLGMIPVQDPARLVVALDGGVTVVGDPQVAVPPPPPPVAAAPAAPPPPAAAADGAPADPAPAAEPADEVAVPVVAAAATGTG